MKARDLSPERARRFEIETRERARRITEAQAKHNRENPNALMNRQQAARRVAGARDTAPGAGRNDRAGPGQPIRVRGAPVNSIDATGFVAKSTSPRKR